MPSKNDTLIQRLEHRRAGYFLAWINSQAMESDRKEFNSKSVADLIREYEHGKTRT